MLTMHGRAARSEPARPRPRVLALRLLLSGVVILLPLAAAAERRPAVKGLQAVFVPEYSYTMRRPDEAVLEDVDTHLYALDLFARLPLGRTFGASGGFGVSGSRVQELGQPGGIADMTGLDASIALFAGSPDLGRIELAYDWDSNLGDFSRHAGSVGLSLFRNAWDSGVRYTHTREILDDLDVNPRAITNGISVFGARYIGNQARLRFSFEWSAREFANTVDPVVPEQDSIVGVTGDLVWLPPLGEQRFFFIRFEAFVGQSKLESATLPKQDSDLYRVGAFGAFFFPGVESLQELFREY